MRYFFTTLIILSFSVFSFSQIQINTTLNLFDLDELNEVLTQNQYPIFDNEAYSFEILSTSYSSKSSKVGTRTGFLYTIFDTKRGPTNLGMPNSNRDAEMRSIGFLSGIEVPIVNNKFITLSPSLDFILSQQRLNFLSNFPGSTTFGNLLSSNAQIETYRNIRLMFDGRVNLIFHLSKKENKTRLGIGVTGGYRLDPWSPTWKYERIEKVEILGTKQNGFHIGVMLVVKFPKITPPPLPNKKEQKS